VKADLNIVSHIVLDDKIIHSLGPGKETFSELGGPAAYSTMAVPIINTKTRIITAIGKDFPEAFIHYLSSIQNLEIETLISENTTRFHHEIYPKHRILKLLAQAENIDDFVQKQKGAKACLLSPVYKEITKDTVSWAKDTHDLVGVDIQGFIRSTDEQNRIFWEYKRLELEWLIEQADFLKLSFHEAQPITHQSRVEEMLRKLPEENVNIITMGKGGLAYSHEGLFYRLYAPSVKERDPTGAGDVLMTAVLAKFTQTKDIGYSIAFGMALAAEKVKLQRIQSLPSKDYDEIAKDILSKKEQLY
jgi:sugar/nucleoside kinase (ribokinase family)